MQIKQKILQGLKREMIYISGVKNTINPKVKKLTQVNRTQMVKEYKNIRYIVV